MEELEAFLDNPLDHIIPKSKAGKDSVDNLRTMCVKCNTIRSSDDLSMEELYEVVKNK